MTTDARRAQSARLKTERERCGWGVRKMARLLRDAVDDHQKPELPSFVTYVKRWESGDVEITDARYRAAYARVLGIPESDLFGPAPSVEVQTFPHSSIKSGPRQGPETDDHSSGRAAHVSGDVLPPDDQERLMLVARRPARIDAVAADSLAAILATQRRTEDTVGSAPMIEGAVGHLRLVLRLLGETRGPLAGRMAAIASDASQFVGWLFTATGAHQTAGPVYDQSRRLGLQAGDNDLAATALSMRGHLAWVTSDFAAMAGLSRAAAELATSPGTRAIAVQQSARALALLGDRDGALRAIGRAEETLSETADRDDPDLLYFYGPTLLNIQRGLLLAYLAESPAEHLDAADLLSGGIDALPLPIRDSEWMAWYRVQAARAWTAGGEVGEGVRGLRAALSIVSATGGAKTQAEIIEAQRSMAKLRPNDSTVAELGAALRER